MMQGIGVSLDAENNGRVWEEVSDFKGTVMILNPRET
jgi:hypothetical protein